MSFSKFFPYDAISRAILNGLFYIFFWVLLQFNDLNKTCVVPPEHSRTHFYTGVTINAFTQINDRNLYHLPHSLTGKGLGYLFAKLMACLHALVIWNVLDLHSRID